MDTAHTDWEIPFIGAVDDEGGLLNNSAQSIVDL
jgi:hypothetical protein